MVDPAFVRTMARYNAWQNESLMAAAEALGDEARKADRGAFFRSIHGTFNHILWADEVWMSRLTGSEKPSVGGRDSAGYVEGWAAFCARRRQRDQAILDWAATVEPDWLRGTLIWYSGSQPRDRQAAGLPDRPSLQPPDPSPRADPRDADGRRRQAGRHRSVPGRRAPLKARRRRALSPAAPRPGRRAPPPRPRSG